MKRLISDGAEGVIIFGNLLVQGAMEFLREKRIKVPEELKFIITSEGLPYYSPGIEITRVQQDIQGLGEMAIKILLEEITTGKKLSRQIVLQPEMVIGNSCGCKKTERR